MLQTPGHPASAGMGGQGAGRRPEAVCGGPVVDGGAAKKVWNEWLDERDRAPAEVFTEWFKEKTMAGLEVAKGYAQAGLEIAKTRTEVAMAAKGLLDEGGEPAREAIRMKQHMSRAIATDQAVVTALRNHSRHWKEEAAFHTDAAVRAQFSDRSLLFARALEALGEPPQEVPYSPVERDASSIVRLGQAPFLQNIARPRPRGVTGEGGYFAGAAQPVPNVPGARPEPTFEELLETLFKAQDLNGNGSIEESELIKLNEKIAMLHIGKGADKTAVREKFSTLFREKLDPDGKPVGYQAFRRYTVQMLNELDTSRNAQEMILEQFIAEAESARAAFHCQSFMSVSDAEYMPHLQGDRPVGVPLGPSLHSLAALQCLGESQTRPPTGTRDEPLPAMPQPEGGRQPAARGAAPPSAAPPQPPPSQQQQQQACSMADRVARAGKPEGSVSEVAAKPAPAIAGGSGRGSGSAATALRHPSVATEEASYHGSPDTTRSSGSALSSGAAAARSAAAEEEALLHAAQRRATGGFAQGDKIQVFSNSKSEWLDGVVVEAFETKREADGYSVPAGTIKVSSPAGVKWIRLDQVAASVRKRPGAA